MAMRLYLRLLYLRFLIPVLILVILLMTLDLPNWQIRLDASTLSAAHWKGTTVRDERNPGLNSIEFQQDVHKGFQQSLEHSVVLIALLKITLNSLLKFN